MDLEKFGIEDVGKPEKKKQGEEKEIEKPEKTLRDLWEEAQQSERKVAFGNRVKVEVKNAGDKRYVMSVGKDVKEVEVGDGTMSVPFTLWGEDADKVKLGDVLVIHSPIMRYRQNRWELTKKREATIEVVEPQKELFIEKEERPAEKVKRKIKKRISEMARPRIEEMPKGVEEEERKAMPIEKEIPPPEEKPELMPQKPEVLKAGKIRLNVWRNVNKFGKTIKTVEVQRVYKDKEGRFKDTYRLRKNDIPKAIALLRRQYERMLEIEEE